MILQQIILAAAFLQVIAFDIGKFTNSNDFKEFSKMLAKGFDQLSAGVKEQQPGAASDSDTEQNARRAGGVQASNAAGGNNTCCLPQGCFTPCPTYGLPMAVPMYPPPEMPEIVPLRAEFEPVIHDHPPLHKIQEIINDEHNHHRHKKSRKKKKYHSSEMSSSSCESDDSSGSDKELSDDSGDSDRDARKFGDFMRFRG